MEGTRGASSAYYQDSAEAGTGSGTGTGTGAGMVTRSRGRRFRNSVEPELVGKMVVATKDAPSKSLTQRALDWWSGDSEVAQQSCPMSVAIPTEALKSMVHPADNEEVALKYLSNIFGFNEYVTQSIRAYRAEGEAFDMADFINQCLEMLGFIEPSLGDTRITKETKRRFTPMLTNLKRFLSEVEDQFRHWAVNDLRGKVESFLSQFEQGYFMRRTAGGTSGNRVKACAELVLQGGRVKEPSAQERLRVAQRNLQQAERALPTVTVEEVVSWMRKKGIGKSGFTEEKGDFFSTIIELKYLMAHFEERRAAISKLTTAECDCSDEKGSVGRAFEVVSEVFVEGAYARASKAVTVELLKKAPDLIKFIRNYAFDYSREAWFPRVIGDLQGGVKSLYNFVSVMGEEGDELYEDLKPLMRSLDIDFDEDCELIEDGRDPQVMQQRAASIFTAVLTSSLPSDFASRDLWRSSKDPLSLKNLNNAFEFYQATEREDVTAAWLQNYVRTSLGRDCRFELVLKIVNDDLAQREGVDYRNADDFRNLKQLIDRTLVDRNNGITAFDLKALFTSSEVREAFFR